MSYYDGDHPYLVEERERYEEEQRRLEQEREERRAYEQRCYEENERQWATFGEGNNGNSDDDYSNYWTSNRSCGKYYYSDGTTLSQHSTFGDYVFFGVINVGLTFIWLFCACQFVYNDLTNGMAIILALIITLIVEDINIEQKNIIYLIIKILIFIIICNFAFFEMYGFMKWFLVFPLVCSITIYLLGKDFK